MLSCSNDSVDVSTGVFCCSSLFVEIGKSKYNQQATMIIAISIVEVKKTAKTLILAGNYERDDMEYKLSVYLKRGRLTQDEYDELIALMDARELVE